jgi:hypothetical protein
VSRGGPTLLATSSPARRLERVQLTDKTATVPGLFKVKLKAARWFTAADANQPAASTMLTLKVGTKCFTHVVRSKTD